MKNFFYVFAWTAILLLGSCLKTDLSNKCPTRLINIANGNKEVETTYKYDDAGRVIEKTEFNQVVQFWYAGGKIDSSAYLTTNGVSEGSYKNIYDSLGRLLLLRQYQSGILSLVRYTYTGNLLTAVDKDNVYHVAYQYNAEGDLIRLDSYDVSDSTMQLSGTNTFVYDDKINPENFTPSISPATAKHNILKLEIYNAYTSYTSTSSYVYEYRADGYPTVRKPASWANISPRDTTASKMVYVYGCQ